MTYENPSETPIVTNYEFPLKDDIVLSALKITTADQTVVAEIQEKEQTMMNFDQIFIDSDFSVVVDGKEGDRFISILTGNLLPG